MNFFVVILLEANILVKLISIDFLFNVDTRMIHTVVTVIAVKAIGVKSCPCRVLYIIRAVSQHT